MSTQLDRFDDPTDEMIRFVLELRGGCNCMHPPYTPPCNNCEKPWTLEEYKALNEEFPEDQKPVDYMKAVRDMCK